MDVDVVPAQAHRSSPNGPSEGTESPAKERNVAGRVDEEEVFYDADETVAERSSDVTPPETSFSIANDEFPTDVSENSDTNSLCSPSVKPKPRCSGDHPQGNLDDVSTDCGSLLDENEKPDVFPVSSIFDDDEMVGESSKQTGANNEKENDRVERMDDAGDEEITNGPDNEFDDREDVPARLGNESVEKSNVSTASVGSVSSMEVMEDDSGSNSSEKAPYAEPQVHSESSVDTIPDLQIDSAGHATAVGAEPSASENTTDEVPANVDAPAKVASNHSNEENHEDIAETSPAVGGDAQTEIEAGDDDAERGQKTVESAVESARTSPPVLGDDSIAENADTDEKIDNDIAAEADNIANSLSLPSTDNILSEFDDDAAQVMNNTSVESIDAQTCPCQVVLFKVDFNEYVTRHETSGAKVSPSDSDSSSSSSSKSTTKRSTANRVVRHGAPKKRSAVSASTSRTSTSASSSPDKPTAASVAGRRKNSRKRAAARRQSRTGQRASSSESDEAPLSQLTRGQQRGRRFSRAKSALSSSSPPAAVKSRGEKHAEAAKIGALSSAANSVARRNGRRRPRPSDERADDDLDVRLPKTLRCVSIPIITEVIKSLKGNSYKELMRSMNGGAARSRRRQEVAVRLPRLRDDARAGRASRRSLSSPSDATSFEADDADYRASVRGWKCDDEASTLSLRSRAKPTPLKKSSRRSAQPRSYAETSASDVDDEFPAGNAKKSRRDNGNVEQIDEEDVDYDDDSVWASKRSAFRVRY